MVIVDDVKNIGNNTVQVLGAIVKLVPEIGNTLKDGNLTKEEQLFLQEKLDNIKGLLHQIKHKCNDLHL